MEVSKMTMNVASITGTAISHGLTRGRHSAADVDDGVAHLTFTFGTTDMPGAMSRLVGQRFVKHNFDRHALDHLDVIAHRIFRRQQAEPRAGSGLQAVHPGL